MGPADTLLRRINDQRRGQGSAVIGFDFPIGVPVAYADAAGIDRFPELLPKLGWGEWRDFYRVAETPDDVSLHRPFYPQRPGGIAQAHLYEGLGFDSMAKLLRESDRPAAFNSILTHELRSPPGLAIEQMARIGSTRWWG